MFISVLHHINEPGKFWASAQKHIPNLPVPGVKRVVYIFPSVAMTQANCIWEADSIESLDKYLRSKLNNWSQEDYFEINSEQAVGL